jgi:nondiscriminating aspartyl-tRNA synthetase
MDKGAWYVQEIKRMLDSKGVRVMSTLTHPPTPSAIDTDIIEGLPLSSAIKALLVKGERTHDHYLLCIPGDRKLDMSKVKSVLGERVVFLKPEVVLEKYGLVVGGVPPIGSLLGVTTCIGSKGNKE